MVVLQGEYVPSTRQWVRDQVEAYERSGGQQANTLPDTGLPVIIMSMRGQRSGSVRKIGLMRVEHQGEYALVGSMGGAPRNPQWVYNLRADPDEVTIQDGPEPFGVHVRELEGGREPAGWVLKTCAMPRCSRPLILMPTHQPAPAG